ncbi:hypothetical protein C3L33_23201, partial [Rhododendron williamsianum]
MTMSNLIGPVEQMALANHPIKGLYFTVIGGPPSLGITMISYAGKLRVTIRMEKGFMDSQTFSSCIENAFDMVFKDALWSAFPIVVNLALSIWMAAATGSRWKWYEDGSIKC